MVTPLVRVTVANAVGGRRADPALTLEHPAYNCNRLEAMLSLEGRRVSSITIQKILNENGLGTRIDRWLALEQASAVEV